MRTEVKTDFGGMVIDIEDTKWKSKYRIRPYQPGDLPIGRAMRDIKAGESIKIEIHGGYMFSDAIEFFNGDEDE
jgi:hypothetical protein